MKIVVYSGKNWAKTLQVSPKMSVSHIKQRISEQTGIGVQSLNLIYSQKILHDNESISSLGMKDEERIQLSLKKAKKRQPQPETQTQLKKIYKKFPEIPYLNVGIGLNLQAKCKTQNCIAYKKNTWVHKGFGCFNISRQIYNCRCPICKELTEPATSVGCCHAYIEFEGKKANEGHSRHWLERQTGFKVYQLGEEWNFMEISTKKIETNDMEDENKKLKNQVQKKNKEIEEYQKNRQEIQKQVDRLKKELEEMRIQEKKRNFENIGLCKFCLERKASIIFVQCGHLCLCSECSQIYNKAECIMCRTPSKKQNVFSSQITYGK